MSFKLTSRSVGAFPNGSTTGFVGQNLIGPDYYTPNQPFLDTFKNAEGWITGNGSTFDTNEESKLDLDSLGWPKSVTKGSGGQTVSYTKVSIPLKTNLDGAVSGNIYVGGNYVVLYDGAGTLNYTDDASVVTQSAGRDVINLTPSTNGFFVEITATDPLATGNYLRNIRIVEAQYETLLTGGEIYHPTYIARLMPFAKAGMRFMDWGQTNFSTEATWSDRRPNNWAYYGGPGWGAGNVTYSGVPWEARIALANKLGCPMWINIPHHVNSTYWTNLANLILANLTSTLNVYVEHSNETWNFTFSQANDMTTLGRAFWGGTVSGDDDFTVNRFWHGYQTAQIGIAFKAVLGSRVVTILGAQADTSTFTATEALLCTPWTGNSVADHVDAIAIAPYFGFDVPVAWTTDADHGKTKLFNELNGVSQLLPTGAGAATTTGTASALLLAGGPASPSQGTLITFNLSVNPSATATLKTGGGTAYPLRDQAGNDPNNVAASGGPYVACWTNATADGSVTASWRILSFGAAGYTGGWLQQSVDITTPYASLISTAYPSMKLFCYENGQSFNCSPTGGPPALIALFKAANEDARMGTAYATDLANLKTAGVVMVMNFQDMSIPGVFGQWGSLENVMDTTSPKYAALVAAA